MNKISVIHLRTSINKKPPSAFCEEATKVMGAVLKGLYWFLGLLSSAENREILRRNT
jgi:hypothetical protein